MITIGIIIALIIIGIILIDKEYFTGWVLAFIGAMGSIFFITFTIYFHAFPERQIQADNIKYESLLERREIINSEYENYSKSDLIRDIAEWNSNVAICKSLLENPWTNIIVSKRVVDNLKYIE